MTDTETSAELVAIDDPEAMIAAVKGEALPEIEDPETVARQIVERILSSDTADDVLGGRVADSAQEVIDRPFVLRGVRLLRSRFDEGPGVFAVLDVTYLDDGEPGAVTCSSRNVMAQAVQLYRLDALPREVVIRKAEQPTAAGYYPLWLASAH